MENLITIDGTDYPVGVVELTEVSNFANKFAKRTEDWDLQRELAGIFFAYRLTVGDLNDQTLLQALWDKVHEFTEYHTVTLPHGTGTQTFTAYIVDAERKLRKHKGGVNTWGGFALEFIAKAPQITE